MSGASSTVSSMVKRGAISTMPPTLATAMIAITNAMDERSSLRWNSSDMSSLSRHGGGRHRHVTRARGGRTGPDRHPDVVAADHRADQEQQPPEGARDIVGIHRHQRVDERIGERTVFGVGPPHQPLDDPGIPH